MPALYWGCGCWQGADGRGVHAYHCSAMGVHTVSYTVNTATGAITSASLTEANGTETLSFSTNLFVGSSLNWVGAAVSSGAGNTTGIVDNIMLTAIPEPA